MFNPLGNFDREQIYDPKIVAAGRAFIDALPAVPVGDIDRLYLHWEVEHFGCVDAKYNGVLNYDPPSDIRSFVTTHDPRDNAKSTWKGQDPNGNALYAAHTYRRNQGAFGFALEGMVGATQYDFGPEAVTLASLSWLMVGAAAVCVKYAIDPTGTTTVAPFSSEPTIMTHAESSWRLGEPPQYDDYFGERWDFGSLVPIAAGSSLLEEHTSRVGDAFRRAIHNAVLALVRG